MYHVSKISYSRGGKTEKLVACIICVIACAIFFVILFDFFERFSSIIWKLVNSTFPEILSRLLLNKAVYYAACFIIFSVIAIFLCRRIYNLLAPKTIDHNKAFISCLFEKRGYGSPVPTRNDLIKNIYGKTRVKKEIKDMLSVFIDKDIAPIGRFLTKAEDKRILCINSKWGSGKTTALLIAINEMQKDDNFYIYESAFKYHGNINELVNDLLSSLEKDMSKLGVYAEPIIDSLICNLDSSAQKTFVNLIKNRGKKGVPSSELVLELNRKYEKSKNSNYIYVIIDDMDRLQGGDIVEILSILSILRNLSFVKLIIPADLDIIAKALAEYGVVDAQRFIEKYLPSKMSLALHSGYDMTERIILDKIFYAQDGWNSTIDGAYPALAAIFIGMLAKKLKAETMNYSKIRYRWLGDPRFSDTRELPEKMNDVVLQLLQEAPEIIREQSNSSKKKYEWKAVYNNITEFQNIIYAITKDHVPIAKLFSDEEYIDTVDSWIFGYMKKRWSIFGFTIRDALDILESTDYKNNLPKTPAKQFAYIFNQLFEKEQLEAIESTPQNKQK